jgi:foldase protein PrsA
MAFKSFVGLIGVTLLVVICPAKGYCAETGTAAGAAGGPAAVGSSAQLAGPMPVATSTESALSGTPSTAGEAAKAVQLPAGTIALVNGEPITTKEWEDTLRRVAGRGILDVMVRHKLVRQAAQKAGITLSDEECQAQYDRAVAAAGGPDALVARLQETGESQEDFKTRMQSEMLLHKLIEKDLAVTDEELKKVYLEQYGRTAEVQVVVTQTQPDAQTVMTRARQGADFAGLAQEYSTDEATSTNHGFLTTQLTDGFFPKQFGRVIITDGIAQVVLALKPGQISNVVPGGEYGYYVFKVTAAAPAKSVAFETVKDKVRQDAKQAKEASYADQYMQQLYMSADIRWGI